MDMIEEEKCENKLLDSSNCEDLTSRVGVALLFIVYYSWWRIQMQTENPCPFFFLAITIYQLYISLLSSHFQPLTADYYISYFNSFPLHFLHLYIYTFYSSNLLFSLSSFFFIIFYYSFWISHTGMYVLE